MKHSIIAIALVFGLGLTATAYAAEGSSQGGMQPGKSLESPSPTDPASSQGTTSTPKKKSSESSLGVGKEQQKDSPSIPDTTPQGSRSGESGSGQGSAPGSQPQPGSGLGTR